MNRLDRHVSAVRNKLALRQFVKAFGWGTLAFASAALICVLLHLFFAVPFPKKWVWIGGGGAATVVGSIIFACLRRPGALEAAAAIDQELALQEKFSTALHARKSDDPFSRAAVMDAEATAERVHLGKQFPLKYPKPFTGSLTIAAVAVAVAMLVKPMNLLAGNEPPVAEKKKDQDKQIELAKQNIRKAVDALDMAPPAVAEKEAIQLAKADLKELLSRPIADPAAANRKALSALQDVQQSLKEEAAKTASFAKADQFKRDLAKLNPGDEKGPVAEAQKSLSEGKFDQAVGKLGEVVNKFDKMTDADKLKAAQQMAKMSDQLKDMANNPAQQQQVQQKLQQLGLNQQQAQQAQQALQQAAQGNPQAQQQLQQLAQQAMKQMNNGQGATQQQQQQVQQMMQQLQAGATQQQQAANMQQAAAQMAKAMQQATSPQSQQAAGQQPGQQPQAAGQQPGQQQGQQAGQQPGQQAGGPQPGQQPGQQPGGNQAGDQPGQQQQMQDAMKQMQDTMDQIQAQQQDAAQVAAAQQAAQEAADAAAEGVDDKGQGDGKGGGQGEFAQGNPNKGQGNGQGGPGKGAGGQAGVSEAPFAIKQEVSKSENQKGGRIIAATLIKADSEKGESKADLKDVAKAAEQADTDEVDSERVSRQAQKAVKDYFGSLGEEKKADDKK